MPYGLMVDGRLKELRDASHYLLSPQETLLPTTGGSDGLLTPSDEVATSDIDGLFTPSDEVAIDWRY